MTWAKAGSGLAATTALVAALLLTAAPASAYASGAFDDVLVSTDGVRFGQGIEVLFDPDRVLVPGESESATVWIRNDSDIAATMRMAMREVTVSSGEFAGAVTLGVTDHATGSTRESPLDAWEDCAVLASSPMMEPGETVKVDLGLAMLDVDGVTAQGQTADLTMVVAMRDGEAGAFPASACQDDGVIISTGQAATDPQRMARTGSELPTHLFVIGGALSGAGIFFAVAGRRTRSR